LSVVHCTAPGEHAAQAPFQQTGVAPAQVIWFSHAPDELHCCTTAPTHWVWPGEHTPVQVFATQAWLTQHCVPQAMPPSHSRGPASSPMGMPGPVSIVPVSSLDASTMKIDVSGAPCAASSPGIGVVASTPPSQSPPLQAPS
jgi:hypothetical protein